MKLLKDSKIAKVICYCFVPILVLIIILNACSLVFYTTYEEDFSEYKSYMDTDRFAKDYLYNIDKAIRIAENEKEYIQSKTKTKTKTETIIYESDTLTAEQLQSDEQDIQKIQYNFYSITRYDILLISKYDLEKIDTNITKLQYAEISYRGFEEIQKQGYEIYTALREDDTEIYAYELLYNFVVSTYQTAPSIIFVSCILLIICMVYILISIGHKSGHEQIYTDGLDKVPYEVIVIIASILMFIEVYILGIDLEFIRNRTNKLLFDSGIILSVLIGFILYTTMAVTAVTTIRRAKAHIFWENTITYRFFKFTLGGLFTNFSQTVKLAIQYGGFILASSILFIISLSFPIAILFLLAFWYFIFKKIFNLNLKN